MKKHYLLITSIACIGLILFAKSFINVKALSSTESIGETQRIVYTLGDYHGRIALYSNNNEIPIKVYDIFTDSLPQTDKELIKNGIEVAHDQLPEIIEDYLS